MELNYPGLGLSPGYVALTSGAVFAVFLVVRITYRIWFHPLARIPGYKLAAASDVLAFYHNVIQRSLFPFVVLRMHNELGPVIRIGPNEIHIRSPAAYQILAQTRLHKDPSYYDLGLGDALALMRDGPDHLRRRGWLIKIIGDQLDAVDQLSKKKVSQLCDVIERLGEGGKAVNLSDMMRSVAYDLATAVYFGEQDNLLGSDDQGRRVHLMTCSLFRYWDFIRFMPVLTRFQGLIPKSISHAIAPILGFEEIQANKIHSYVVNDDWTIPVEKKPKLGAIHRLSREPSYLANNNKDLVSEAMETGGGSSEAVAYAILHILRLLMEHPRHMQLLRNELESNRIKDVVNCPFETLQQLPFLNAVFQEAERLQVAGSYRFPRVLEEPMQVGRYLIPTGSVVTFTQVVCHRDPNIFDSPDEFKPERWQTDSPRGAEGLMVQGLGRRKCIGQRLVMRTILRPVAQIVQKFHMEFVDTCPVSRERDGFATIFPPASSKGMRVYVRPLSSIEGKV